jgi:hypothetical protein
MMSGPSAHAIRRVALVIAVTLPLAACGKEQPKKAEIEIEVTDIRAVWRVARAVVPC